MEEHHLNIKMLHEDNIGITTFDMVEKDIPLEYSAITHSFLKSEIPEYPHHNSAFQNNFLKLKRKPLTLCTIAASVQKVLWVMTVL